MNRIAAIILLTVYMTAWFTYALSCVGETSTGTTYTWGLPFRMLLFMSFPALLGYEIGRARGESR